jgi:hypothetical protein
MDLNSPESLALYISELLSILATEVREALVAQEVRARLVVLREAYKRNKKIFSSEQIQWLQDVRAKGEIIQSFIELKEEFELANDTQDFQDLLAKLSQLRQSLHGTGVARRIDKEIRSLRERFPDLLQNEAIAKATMQISVINELDRKAPTCPRGHKMTIRSGPTGYFWGCSEFPNCFTSQQLSCEQQGQIENA